MCTNCRMNKQFSVQPYNEILLINLQKATTDRITGINLKSIMLRERSQISKIWFHLHMKFQKRQNHSSRQDISGCQGKELEEDRDYKEPQGNLQNNKNTIKVVIVATLLYMKNVFKTHGITQLSLVSLIYINYTSIKLVFF